MSRYGDLHSVFFFFSSSKTDLWAHIRKLLTLLDFYVRHMLKYIIVYPKGFSLVINNCSFILRCTLKSLLEMII